VRNPTVIRCNESQVYEYDSPHTIRVLGLQDALDGGAIIPEFRLPLAELFEGIEPSEPS
jgi:hypothetical protein